MHDKRSNTNAFAMPRYSAIIRRQKREQRKADKIRRERKLLVDITSDSTAPPARKRKSPAQRSSNASPDGGSDEDVEQSKTKRPS